MSDVLVNIAYGAAAVGITGAAEESFALCM